MKQNPIIPPPLPPSHLAQAWKKILRGIIFLSVGIVAIQHTDSMLPFVCLSILLHFR